MHIIKEFISPPEALFLAEQILPHASPYHGVLSSYGVQTVDFAKLPQAVHDRIISVIPFTEKLIKETFTTTPSLALGGRSIAVMPQGAHNPLHVDDAQPYPNPDIQLEVVDAPTHVYKRHFSAVFMLGGEYEGGFLEFPNQDKKYHLNPGQVIIFKGDEDNPHQVSTVTKGTRINFIMFFVEDL